MYERDEDGLEERLLSGEKDDLARKEQWFSLRALRRSHFGRMLIKIPNALGRRAPNQSSHGHFGYRLFRWTTGLVWRGFILLCIVGLLVAIFWPSYSSPPAHYQEFRRAVQSSTIPGRANSERQKVFIAASLYDPQGDMLSGDLGRSMLELVQLLGPSNTFLSVYISDSGQAGQRDVSDFEAKVPCPHKILAQEHTPVEDPGIIILPDGEPGIKRIKYLTTARNMAMEPLTENGPFDKILFLNDIWFDPIEAAQLLFLTNMQEKKPTYNVACAADFDNPWKFYDTFASRDMEGHGTGVPIYPWFTAAAAAQTRSDILRQVDAVHVKSCWGGMIAFDASYFQKSASASAKYPIRFRAEQELENDYSECCLVNADIASIAADEGKPMDIYLNPYIRTAYDATSFRYFWVGRRTERVLGLIQETINWFAGLPEENEARMVNEGDMLRRTLWTSNSSESGHWRSKSTPATAGQFCRVPGSMVRRLELKPGQGRWEKLSSADDFARTPVVIEE